MTLRRLIPAWPATKQAPTLAAGPAAESRAAAILLLLLASCSDFGGGETTQPELAPLERSGRFGSLRDFVLYRRLQEEPGQTLLVDRFEATQDDWSAFVKTPAGQRVAAKAVVTSTSGSLPAFGMNLQQARAFAHWRLGRLPTYEEWRFATVGGGSSVFPWGVKEYATHANTGDLGLGELTPVGTFESGRRAGGNTPYDLIGNVSEWTETVPVTWCGGRGFGGASSFTVHQRRVMRVPALACWSVLGLIPPATVAVIAGGQAPRQVVGADYQTPMRDVFEHQEDTQLSAEGRQRTGLRVYSTIDELLGRLFAMSDAPAADERRQLIRFVARKGHRDVLTAAFQASPMAAAEFPAGSIAALLAEQLRGSLPETK